MQYRPAVSTFNFLEPVLHLNLVLLYAVLPLPSPSSPCLYFLLSGLMFFLTVYSSLCVLFLSLLHLAPFCQTSLSDRVRLLVYLGVVGHVCVSRVFRGRIPGKIS